MPDEKDRKPDMHARSHSLARVQGGPDRLGRALFFGKELKKKKICEDPRLIIGG